MPSCKDFKAPKKFDSIPKWGDNPSAYMLGLSVLWFIGFRGLGVCGFRV